MLDHDRRKILHVGATYQHSAAWTRNQLAAALPFECNYDYLVCDNDKMYSSFLQHRVEEDFGLKVKQISQGCPWQNASSYSPLAREELSGTINSRGPTGTADSPENHAWRLAFDLLAGMNAQDKSKEEVYRGPGKSRPVEFGSKSMRMDEFVRRTVNGP